MDNVWHNFTVFFVCKSVMWKTCKNPFTDRLMTSSPVLIVFWVSDDDSQLKCVLICPLSRWKFNISSHLIWLTPTQIISSCVLQFISIMTIHHNCLLSFLAQTISYSSVTSLSPQIVWNISWIYTRVNPRHAPTGRWIRSISRQKLWVRELIWE